jgi:hypothetical protein
MANTSAKFHPDSAQWVKCSIITHTPHSNECGSGTLLVLTIMATYPSPHKDTIIPWLHLNIALISRWWAAACIFNKFINIEPFKN